MFQSLSSPKFDAAVLVSAGQVRSFGTLNSFDITRKCGTTTPNPANSFVPPSFTGTSMGNLSLWSLAKMRAARPICLILLVQAIICAMCFAADSADKTKKARTPRTTTTAATSFSFGPLLGLLETYGVISQNLTSRWRSILEKRLAIQPFARFRQKFRPRFDGAEALVAHRELALTQMIDPGQKRFNNLGTTRPFPSQQRWEHNQQQSASPGHERRGRDRATIHKTESP